MSSKLSIQSLDSSSGRDRRNSASSTSSSSPFLNNSFRSHTAPRNYPPAIQLEDMGSCSSTPPVDAAALDETYTNAPPPNFFRKIYNRLMSGDNFKGNSRNVYINDMERNREYKYCGNTVTTSKYTLITFLPKNLFEQFCRLANFYFLIISAIQIIPGISPTGRFTTLGPLLVVLAITAIKEAYEDFRRHRQDDRVNNCHTEVLRGSTFVDERWKNLKVGDIVKVLNRQYIPADLVVLASSEPQSTCYVETANLDGETNLKLKQGLNETAQYNSLDNLATINSNIECEHPNNRLYSFIGSMYLDGKGHPLSARQVLMRGSLLRNTKWIYGVVIYSGRDTKLMRNSSDTPSKRSGVEKKTNVFILIIFILQMLLCLGAAIANGVWNNRHVDDWYLLWSDQSPVKNGAMSFLTFLILFNNIIPISLYVSMEFVKVFQAFFINNDQQMYHADNDTPALARTSNLNEDLGQIDYIFSDKTGTLTQNKMEFKKCSIGGVSYGSGMTEATMGAMMREGAMISDQPAQQQQLNNDPTTNSSNELLGASNCESPPLSASSFRDAKLNANLNSEDLNMSKLIKEFFSVLAVCHTVVPEEENGVITYQASSPDESALVTAAKEVGFNFCRRSLKSVTIIDPNGQELEFQILNILEFNSVRKRMSVIVRHPDGRLLLYTKGADTAIFERLAPNQTFADSTINHLQEYASEGLRTLCVAYREIEPAVYESWSSDYYTASNTIIGREAALDRMAEAIERKLILLGATAIEDRLQVGVPESIASLREAGIKLWVLTGDKQETAINIGYACRLLTNNMELLVVNESSIENTDRELKRLVEEYRNGHPTKDLALIIDGSTLVYVLENKEMALMMLKISERCKSVIACRVSPSQKADIVGLVRDNLDAVTLAIGDGANDVNMIQRAHVGIGISGEEGLQAARCSDYAIAQFRFLTRLLLVHGRYSYRRISKLIAYCFYKNITLYITQFWFTIFNGWSGQTYYERYTLTLYNILWTFFPIIVFGILDKDVSEQSIMDHPHLYSSGPRHHHFNIKVFWGWICNGVFHSFVLYALPMGIYHRAVPFASGFTIDLISVGIITYACVVITVNCKLALETRFWTWINHLATWGSIVLFFIWLMAFGKFEDINQSLGVGVDIYDIIFNVGKAPLFYLTLVIVPVVCLYRDYTWKFVNRYALPQAYHIVQELDSSHSSKQIETKLRYTGYAFSQEPGQADYINNKFVV
ncbi:hypothetical protein SAMD00019534_104020 [Acytostelium subglobosum LB1]|uniref:hypothetical protein n=1 Tax=Acytostelium subglobosum LB1 TaxID=1410327 RepID=UPI000644C9B7|nr:hypothetical protein SAMD00019534_104020 [Acytostelium subglobosum LB1]GAM27227.1 hypothetical protein SAMD00019534_104020 [Acytostelium subglobosum LB1]|eukprot:XP_012749694.1 hypothetical protein SAMD00019534_104020 [Acytostelium subglobosum LB1]